MNIGLIWPGFKPNRGFFDQDWFFKRVFLVQRLNLPIIASLTSPDIEVFIIDELVDRIDFNVDVDMIGITTQTQVIPRAYEIADKFKERGVPVVLGGIHATALPLEAKEHAESVVIGEGEGVWQKLIEDFKSGKLKKFYRSNCYPCLDNLPIPRRDLLNNSGYLGFITPIMFSRGCPFHCEFCSVSIHFGHQLRLRPIEEVLKEIETIESEYLFFPDADIAANPDYCKKLCKKLIPYQKKWLGQASISVADDNELLKLLSQSGCKNLCLGFESLSNESLKDANKSHNLNRSYKGVIQKLHDYGIEVGGAFIFGFDHDNKSIFENTVKFIQESKIEVLNLNILTPFPGTLLYHRLNKEKRLLREKWWLEDFYNNEVLFKPKLMSVDELKDGYDSAVKEVYSYCSMFRRLKRDYNVPWIHRFGNLMFNLGRREKYFSMIK